MSVEWSLLAKALKRLWKSVSGKDDHCMESKIVLIRSACCNMIWRLTKEQNLYTQNIRRFVLFFYCEDLSRVGGLRYLFCEL